MDHIARVNRLSDDRSGIAVTHGDGALACPCAHAGNIERADGALQIAQKAMIYAACVEVISHDRSLSVVAFREGTLACSCARGRNIVRGESALFRSHETMKHTVYVDVDSFNPPVWSKTYAECTVAVARHVSARDIDRGKVAVLIAKKGVTDEVCVKVEARDLTQRIDGVGVGEYRAQRIKLGDFTVISAHEAVLN